MFATVQQTVQPRPHPLSQSHDHISLDTREKEREREEERKRKEKTGMIESRAGCGCYLTTYRKKPIKESKNERVRKLGNGYSVNG